MGLFTTAPDIELEGTREAFIGRPYEAVLVVTTAEDIPCSGIDLRLLGRRGWSVSQGKSSVSNRETSPDATFMLWRGGGTLARGTHRFPVRLQIPGDVVPSHALGPASADLSLIVVVDIPWKIDPRARFFLHATLPPPTAAPRTPIAVQSRDVGARAPRVELALPSSVLLPGEPIEATVAFFNLDDDEPVPVRLSAIATVDLHGRGRRDREVVAWTSDAALPAGSAGVGTPLAFRLPSDLPVSFRGSTHSVSWQLEAAVGGGLLRPWRRVRAPIVIIDDAAARTVAPLAGAPLLGDARTHALFEVAAQARPAWTVVAPEAGEADEAAAATLEVDGVTARLAYLESKATGGVLRTTLRHADLGLGLAVTPGSTTRHLFWRDVEIGVPAWDRAHHVRARDGEQVRDYLRRLAPALAAVPGALVRWDDHGATIDEPCVGVSTPRLEAAMQQVEALAARLAHELGQLPPPRDVALDGDQWRSLARVFDASLTPCNAALDGTLDGAPLHTCLRRTDDGDLRDLRVWVGDAASASALARATVLSLPAPAAGALATGVPPALTELLLGWPDDHVDLDLRGGVASASLRLVPGPDGRAVVSADATIELARRLRTLLAALGAERTPFR
jgi:hypothetical protein